MFMAFPRMGKRRKIRIVFHHLFPTAVRIVFHHLCPTAVRRKEALCEMI